MIFPDFEPLNRTRSIWRRRSYRYASAAAAAKAKAAAAAESQKAAETSTVEVAMAGATAVGAPGVDEGDHHHTHVTIGMGHSSSSTQQIGATVARIERRRSGTGILEFTPIRAGQDVTPANFDFRGRLGSRGLVGTPTFDSSLAGWALAVTTSLSSRA